MMNIKRVLCVDDDPVNLKMLENTLRFKGFEVTTASSGHEAMRILNSEGAFHIVIADYRMPGMNGVTLLKHVKVHWPNMLRILMSGQSDAQIFIPMIFLDVIDKYICKPWDKNVLLQAIDKSIGRKQAIDDKRWEAVNFENFIHSAR